MAIIKEIGTIKKILDSQIFSNEKELEAILAEQPSLMINEGEPNIRLVKQQVPIEGVGTADLLLIDANGLPMIVEVKLARNGESRRQVVGQIFDYVSALTLLTVDELDERVSGDLEKAMTDLTDEETFEICWKACGTNLRAGKARVVVPIDEAYDDLVRIIRFLNDHSDLDVRLVEIKQYADQESLEKIYVPRLIVHGGETSGIKRSQQSSLQISENNFIDSLDEYGKTIFARILKLASYNSFPIHWGSKGFSINVDYKGNHIALLYCYPPDSGYKQSIYTDFFRKGSRLSRIVSSDIITSILVPAVKGTNLFEPAGQEYRCKINRNLSDNEINSIELLIEKMAEVIIAQANHN